MSTWILILCLSFNFQEGLGLKLLVAERWDTNETATLEATWNLNIPPEGGLTKDTYKECTGDGNKLYNKAGKGALINAQAKAMRDEMVKKCVPLIDAAKLSCLLPIGAKIATMESSSITAFSILIERGKTGQSLSFYEKCVPTKNDIFFDAGLSSFVVHSSKAGEFAKWAAWAKNDPIVKNVAGEQFEILATGVFTMLTVQNSNGIMLEANATIDRAGTRCGATYIQDLSLKGEWVEDLGVPQIQIRAESAVPKHNALQVNFDGEWKHSSAKWFSEAIQKSNAQNFFLKLHQLQIKVSIDSHRIQEGSKATNRFANFLNVNFEGVSHLSDMLLGGLLGRDSHTDAAKLPMNCHSKTNKLLSDDSTALMLSTVLIE
jgi:hypothetical protein